jgi:hypothetical protein
LASEGVRLDSFRRHPPHDENVTRLCDSISASSIPLCCASDCGTIASTYSAQGPILLVASNPQTVRRYGVALFSAGAAALVVHALQSVSGQDARPVLLVAIAVGALYGGLGPGLVALVVAAIAAPDAVIVVAGAALAAVCAGFRRARSAGSSLHSPAGSQPNDHRPAGGAVDRLQGMPEGFPPDATRVTPSFAEVTTEATWRFHHEQPLDITLPEDDQVEHLYLYSVLAECNDAFARMYGFRSAAEVVGTRLVVFLPPSNPENVAYLRSFIRSGYRLEDAASHEIDRYGNAKDFVNNLVGIFERGELVGAWGTQRDVTGAKGNGGTQEYRSRLHNSKSSSQ